MRTLALLTIFGVACGSSQKTPESPVKTGTPIRVAGSSTVHPITKNVIDRYGRVSKNPVELELSSTGAGLQRFCHGAIDLAGASRPITDREMKECAAAGVEFVELPVAFDGIAVVVHPDNDWVTTFSVAELKRIWEPAAQGKILKWSDLNPRWPAVRLHLVGPDSESGTYDYFTKAIVGQEGESRRDYFASDDDDALVAAVARDGLALGFFGFAYYHKNERKLRAVAIDDGVAVNGAGPVAPTLEAIRDNRYRPLSRPLFLYVNVKSLDREEVADFTRFYVDAAAAAVADAGDVPLPRRALDLVAARLAKRVKGSNFEGGGAELGLTLESLVDAYHVEVTAKR
jgi:phosphate transport system substrate-binding protein